LARPKQTQPTPGELELLSILWERGASTVREVLEVLEQRSQGRAYTSVMSLLNVMAEKKLVIRKAQGRAFVYVAKKPRDATLGGLVGDLWQRAFGGSAAAVVMHLLDEANPSAEELAEIRKILEAHQPPGEN
jgi:predicted transcriptional regulator